MTNFLENSNAVLTLAIIFGLAAFGVRLWFDQRNKQEEFRLREIREKREFDLQLMETESRLNGGPVSAPMYEWNSANPGGTAVFRADQVRDERPTRPGDYLTLTFNKGPQPTDGQFAQAMVDALELPHHLAAMSGLDEDDIEVRVEKVTFENPLVVTILIYAASGAGGVGMIALLANARRLSDLVNKMRRDWSDSNLHVANNEAEIARAKRQKKLQEELTESVDVEDGPKRKRALQAVTDISVTGAEHDLRSISHNEVPSLESVRRSDPGILRAVPRGVLGQGQTTD